MQGQPKLPRVEPRPFIQAGVPTAAVAAAFPKGGFTARWSGTLHAPVTGDYTITPSAGFGRPQVKVFLDDKELEAPPPPTTPAPGRGAPVTLSVHLEANHAYRLRIEYRPQGPADRIADFVDAAGRAPAR